MSELDAAIKDLNLKKAQGYDEIKVEVLQMLFNTNPDLMFNFNYDIQNKRTYTESWKLLFSAIFITFFQNNTISNISL